MTDLLGTNSNFWHTTTFVNEERIMAKAVEAHARAIAKIKAASKTGNFSSLCLFQGIPSFYSELGDERGGNVMGLDQHLKGRNAISLLLSSKQSWNCLLLLIALFQEQVWPNIEQKLLTSSYNPDQLLTTSVLVNVSEEEIREFGLQVTREFLKEVDDFAKSVDGYIDWTYINYADKAQDPLGSLLDPKGIKSVALKYDPEGVFQKKTPGGFKISKYIGS
jgi:hypothetical protein